MRTLGQHIATRLVEIGVTHVFGVPGDFNLVLLDQLLTEARLTWVGCCNELNAGYAADGYARARGVGACVATFTVGGLSIINAIAGAYSEDLPVICITGGPNSNDSNSNKLLHHTIGLLDREQELRCFQQVTCAQAAVKHLDDAHDQVDLVIATALRERKPVYINIACNLAGEMHPTFTEEPIPFAIYPKLSNQKSLEAAVATAAEFLNSKGKCAIVGGVKVRSCNAEDALLRFADATQYPVTVMANAKSFFPEDHPNFIGTYWGQVSSPFAAEIVESADAYVVVGPTFNDYTTCGWSLLLTKTKTIQVDKNSITIGGVQQYHCIVMSEFLTALAEKVHKNTKSMDIYRRMYTEPSVIPRQEPGTPLLTKTLYKHVEGLLTHDTAVLAETGDSWFNCQKLKLPNGCRYEFQCQFGSIGWAVGATLGYSIGLGPKKRLISSIGDGSFQVTAQDITTAMRFRQNPIIFLINNGGYTIEVEIHDGPYNKIQNWDYVKLIESMDNGNDQSWAVRVKTEEELEAAIQTATTEKADKLCFIEAIIHTDDCSRELLEWGSRVAAFNARPPNPQ